MRGLTSTVLLVLVLAGLGAYIYFIDSERPAAGVETKDKVFDVDADQIEEITVTTDGETTVLRKSDGAWKITSPVAVDADDTAASGLATALAGLEVNRVVEGAPADLAEYGLADPHIRLAFKAANGAGGEVLLGDKNATQSDLFAMKPGENRVFLVQAWQETSLARKTFDLRDKRVLHFDRDKVDTVTLAAPGAPGVTLSRSGNDWAVSEPIRARGDYSAIEGLLTRLASASMTRLVDPNGPETFGLDPPRAVITVGSGSSRASLELGAATDGAVYARDPARQLIFTVDSTLADDATKPVDAYRDKDVFEFRPFDVLRLRISRDGKTFEFQKLAGAGENGTDKWQRVADGATTDVDATKMDDLLTRLSSLRAQSFNPTTNAAGTAPATTVSVSYDGDKFERVRIIDGERQAFAVRDGEPGVGVLDDTAYEDAIKALAAVTGSAGEA